MKTDLIERMEEAMLKLKAQSEQDKLKFGGKSLTYDMWKSYGFQVMEGQRAVKRTRSGNYLFTFDQVFRIAG